MSHPECQSRPNCDDRIEEVAEQAARIAALEAALKQNYTLATDHILTQMPDPVRNGAYLKLSKTMRELGLI
jgi:hypothetical protein